MTGVWDGSVGSQNLVQCAPTGDIVAMNLTRRHFVAGCAGLAAAIGGGAVLSGNRLDAARSRAPGPAGRPPLRVALATDMHAPHDWFEPGELARAVAAFDPDILLISGDAMNRRGDEALVREYASLPARHGKFAALGNWEYQGRCDLARLRREYDRAGVRLLVNEEAVMDVGGERVRVVGLDDFLRGVPRLDLLERDPPGAGRTLVMAHCPILFHDVVRVSPSPRLVFAGHTHGGQIAPFGRALVVPAGSGGFVKGWYGAPRGGHQLYVSRGLGNSSVPLRIGAPPEIALLTV
jgi:predicted MPP superfamily phosphohydrolase